MSKSFRGPIIFGVTLIAIMGAIAAFYFWTPGQSPDVSMELSTDPANVLAGNEFTLSVALANDAAASLSDAQVSVILPDGVASVESPSQRVVTQSIGAIDAGAVSHEDFHLIVTGQAETVQHIAAQLTYRTNGSSAQFQNGGTIDVPVGQPSIGVNIVAPASVFSGQNFSVAVNYINNTNQAIAGASLMMQYPSSPAFTFSRATSTPLLTPNGNNSWNLGTVPPNGSGTLTITGNLVGPNGAIYPIAADVVQSISGQNYTIANPIANIQLAASPLSISLAANNSQNYVSKPGDAVTYTLTYANNSNATFQDVVISANLTGAMFDFPTLSTNGAFNSVAGTITWNAAAAPQLASLAPGQSGSISFRIGTKNAFPIRLPSNKNYSLLVNAKIVSPTVPAGTAAGVTISATSLTTKLGGAISLGEKAYHAEPTAGVGGSLGASKIKNSGPYPPRVNQATQYTVHWLVTNYATDAQNVTISAYLQAGISCTGVSATSAAASLASASSTLTCNPSNGLVQWQIPFIAATTGITGKPLEAVFQITDTPAVNQVGQIINLIGPATLTATDAFTSSTMQSSAPAVTTAMPDDASVATLNRGVVQ